jgi:hypothetical protein
MSIYGKFLVEFTPGDWSLVWTVNEVRDVPPGSTTTVLSCSFSTGDATQDILGFVSTLNTRISTAMHAEYSTAAWNFTLFNRADVFPANLAFNAYTYSSGEVTDNLYFDRVNFTTSSDGILNALGFDQTETTVSNAYIIANDPTRYCWFPGVKTYGGTGGAGITSDTGWVPVDAHSRIVSGAGNMRITGPSRLQYTRRLRFEAMKRSEVLESRHTGPIAFFDQWATKHFRWYPDRDVGVVGTPGTQGDPGPSSYHTDDDCSYWRCALASEPRITQSGDPDWFTVTIELNGEPA